MARYIFTDTGDMPTEGLNWSQTMPSRTGDRKNDLRAIDVLWLNEASQSRSQFSTLITLSSSVPGRAVYTLSKSVLGSQMQRVSLALQGVSSPSYLSYAIRGFIRGDGVLPTMDNVVRQGNMSMSQIFATNHLIDSSCIYNANEIAIPSETLFASGHRVVAADVASLFSVMLNNMRFYALCDFTSDTNNPFQPQEWQVNSTIYDGDHQGTYWDWPPRDVHDSIFTYVNGSITVIGSQVQYIHYKAAADGNVFGNVLERRAQFRSVYMLVQTTVIEKIQYQDTRPDYNRKSVYLDWISPRISRSYGWILSDGNSYSRYYLSQSNCESIFNTMLFTHSISLKSGITGDLYNSQVIKCEIVALCPVLYHSLDV